MDVPLIQLMARWSSNVVLRYIAEVPLETMGSVVRSRTVSSSLSSSVGALRRQVADLASERACDVKTLAYLRDELALAQGRSELPAPVAGASGGNFIKNDLSGKVHNPILWNREVSVASWRAACGFRFGAQSFSAVSLVPESCKLTCGVCFPAELRLAPAGFSDSSVDSSSSSLSNG